MLFQSTPAIAGGRIKWRTFGKARGDSFNPRPPLLAGESVSHISCAQCSASFNPRPPLLAGESLRM